MAAAASLGQSRVRTLRKAESVLAGPTGERNVLSWRAPARVWLYGGSLAASFTALVSLASAGVQAVVLPDHPLAAYADRLGGLLAVTDKPRLSASCPRKTASTSCKCLKKSRAASTPPPRAATPA